MVGAGYCLPEALHSQGLLGGEAEDEPEVAALNAWDVRGAEKYVARDVVSSSYGLQSTL